MNATEPIRLTEIRKLEVRPGGELVYAMTATAPEAVEFMKNAGMPLTTESRKTLVEITPADDRVRVVMTVEPLATVIAKRDDA